MYGAVYGALVVMPCRDPGKRKIKGMLACYGKKEQRKNDKGLRDLINILRVVFSLAASGLYDNKSEKDRNVGGC